MREELCGYKAKQIFHQFSGGSGAYYTSNIFSIFPKASSI